MEQESRRSPEVGRPIRQRPVPPNRVSSSCMSGETSNNRRELASTRNRLIIGICISIAFVVAEAVVGIMQNSLSLVSDAGHNAADTFAMGLALFAVFMMGREATERRTYGYGRVGILTALANAVGLVLVAGILAYEAVKRMIHIEQVSGYTILIVAAAAFCVNTVVALTLYGHRHDLNIKSAFLHMVADAGISLGVVVAGIVIVFTDWYYADPIAALVISLFIFYAAWGIIRDATDILLESVPRHIDINRVREAMESVPGVESVHHLHIWELGSGIYAMSGHVEVEDMMVSDCSGIMEELKSMLQGKFNIVHPTIQIECAAACPTEAKRPWEEA